MWNVNEIIQKTGIKKKQLAKLFKLQKEYLSKMKDDSNNETYNLAISELSFIFTKLIKEYEK